MPRTEAQIEASRRNGARSGGPRTEEGKERSSRNALKHGAMAVRHRPDGEPPERFAVVEQDLVRNLRPDGSGELTVVRGVATDLLRLDRLDRAEAASAELQRLEHRPPEAIHQTHNDYVLHRLMWVRVRSVAYDALDAWEDHLRTAGDIVEAAVKQAETHCPLDVTVSGVGRMLNIVGALQLTGRSGSEGNVELVVELADLFIEYLDELAGRRKEEITARRRYAEELAEIPDEKLVRRFDKYRSAIENSILRRIEILKGLKELGVDVHLGGD